MFLVMAIHDPKTIAHVVESEHGSIEDRFPQLLNNTTFDVARQVNVARRREVCWD